MLIKKKQRVNELPNIIFITLLVNINYLLYLMYIKLIISK